MSKKRVKYEILGGQRGIERSEIWSRKNFLFRSFCLYMIPFCKSLRNGPDQLSNQPSLLALIPGVEPAHSLGLRLGHNYLHRIFHQSPRSRIYKLHFVNDLSWSILHTFWPRIALTSVLNILVNCALWPLQILAFGWFLHDLVLEHNSASNGVEFKSETFVTNATTISNSSNSTGVNEHLHDGLAGESLASRKVLHGCLMLLATWLLNLSKYPIEMQSLRLGLECRAGVTQLLHKKLMRTSILAIEPTIINQLKNLVTNYVHQFDEFFLNLSNLISCPLQLAALLAALAFSMDGLEIFTLSLSCLGLTSLFLMIQTHISRLIYKNNQMLTIVTSERQNYLTQIAANYNQLVMRCQQDEMLSDLKARRSVEMNLSRKYLLLSGYLMQLQLISAKTLLIVLVTVNTLFAFPMRPDIIFTSFLVAYNLRELIMIKFPKILLGCTETYIATNLIERFLNLPENYQSQLRYNNKIDYDATQIESIGVESRKRVEANRNSSPETCNDSETVVPVIRLNRLRVNWDQSTGISQSFYELSLAIKKQEIVLVTGGPNSGKTSLLMAIAGELPVSRGSIKLNGKIVYSTNQKTWLADVSIRDNILLGSNTNAPLYNEILKVTNLETELWKLPRFDLTEMTSPNSAHPLSHHINLARSLYHEAEIYLFDEPLWHIPMDIVSNVINWLKLRQRTVILATRNPDKFITICKPSKIVLMRGPDKVALVSNGLSSDDHQTLIGDEDYKSLLEKQLEDILQISIGSTDNDPTIIDHEPSRFDSTEFSEFNSSQMEESVSFYGIRAYARNSNLFLLILFVLGLTISQMFSVNIDYIISKSSGRYSLSNETFSQILYSAVFGLYMGLKYLGVKSVIWNNTKLSANLFRNVIENFSRMPKLIPAHRFNMSQIQQYLQTVNTNMPIIIIQTFDSFMVTLGFMILACLCEPISGLILFVMFSVSLITLRGLCNPVIREFRLLEAKSRPNVWNQFRSETAGLSIIRSLGAQNYVLTLLEKYQDLESICTIGRVSATKFPLLTSDILCLLATSVVVSLIMTIVNSGAEISGVLSLLMLIFMILPTQMRETMIMLDSLDECAHIMSNGDQLFPEKPSRPSNVIESNQYADGMLQFYAPRDTLNGDIEIVGLTTDGEQFQALYDVNIHIEAGQKIGIINVKGNNSLSLLAAIMQVQPYEGDIRIGSMDIQYMNVERLRKRISYIPEDPILLNTNISSNLVFPSDFDSGIATRGYDLLDVLEATNLKSFIDSLPDGLDEVITNNGSNISIIGRQLICLARSIIIGNTIIIIEEPPAHLTEPSEWNLFEDCINKSFEDCTVITIIRRKLSIDRQDKMFTFESGKLVERNRHSQICFD